MLKKPEELPEPLLKNPDDGAPVVLPKPGPAGIENNGISIGPTVPVMLPNDVYPGPPMRGSAVVR